MRYLVYCIALMSIYTSSVRAQCKSFFKTKCLDRISPYTFTGEAYTETFFDRDTLVMDFVFYANRNYRLALCVQPTLPNSYFEVRDKDGVLYFSSREQAKNSSMFQYWDFKTNATLRLKVIIYALADKKEKLDVVPSGCIAIFSGFK